MSEMIYINTTRAEWDLAQTRGEFRAPSLESEGFIHASTAAQIESVLDRKFQGRRDLILLSVDTDKIKAPLKWEVSLRDGLLYPHLFGALNLDAVESARELRPESNGSFRIFKSA
jgi:uncharacterized protein (DUF952 family)